MTDTAKAIKENKEGGSNYFTKAMNLASTMQFMQDSNVEGGKKLAKLISTIMSWGGEAASDSVTE